MKCPNCGANLLIDDALCPFCGTENPYAKQHRKEMRHFTKEFDRTKNKILGKSRKINQVVVKIAMIAVLFALDLLLIMMIDGAFDIEGYVISKRIESNYDFHKNNLETFIENKDYIGFEKYYDYQALYFSDEFDEYGAMKQVCSAYSHLYRFTLELYTYEEDEDFFSYTDRFEFCSDQLHYMYDYSEPSKYSDQSEYTPDKLAFMRECVSDAEDIIQVFFNLTDEERESLKTLSNARRQVLLEEGALRNEQ